MGRQANSGSWRAALAVVAIWAILALVQNWNSASSDLASLYMAGHALAEGQPDLVYASTQARVGKTPPEWLETIRALGDPWPDAFPYLYPPLWAKLMALMTPHVGPVAFNHAAIAWHVLALAASILLAARFARPSGLPPLIWCGLSVALIQLTVFSQVAFHFNQPQMTIVLLTLLAFERLDAGRPGLAGIVLGLAAAIKILPGLLVLVFLFDRQWRAAASFALTVTGLAALSLMLAGPALHVEYMATLAQVKTTLPLVPSGATAISAFTFLAYHAGLGFRDLNGTGGYFNPETLPALPWLLWGARAGFAITVAAFAWRLAPLPSRQRRVLGLMALSVAIPLFGQMGWLHYYLTAILLLPVLYADVSQRVAILAFACFIAVTSSELYIAWAMAQKLDWTVLNISVVGVWIAVLALIWRSAGLVRPTSPG